MLSMLKFHTSTARRDTFGRQDKTMEALYCIELLVSNTHQAHNITPLVFYLFIYFLFLFRHPVKISDLPTSAIRGLTREFLTLLMPLFFFSLKRLLYYIILVLGLRLGELPNLFVLDFLCQTSISCILSLL
jgi:hypothetical protein